MNETFKELFARGYQARREDRLADSRAIFIEALRKTSIETDRPSLAGALCGLAQAERDIGNPEAASHHMQNAAVLYRQVGPPARLAYAIRHEADVLREMCHPAEAEPHYLGSNRSVIPHYLGSNRSVIPQSAEANCRTASVPQDQRTDCLQVYQRRLTPNSNVIVCVGRTGIRDESAVHAGRKAEITVQ
jgi:hypothetical protein